MVITMIETLKAVDLAESFLAIDGVDAILVGSNDLCTELGIPGQYDDSRYQNLVTKVVRTGVKAGKPVGIDGIGGRLDLLEKWFNTGALFSLSAADGAILQAGMRDVSKVYKEINQRVQQYRTSVTQEPYEPEISRPLMICKEQRVSVPQAVFNFMPLN